MKKGQTFKTTRELDMRDTGGPLIPAGTRGIVKRSRREEKSAWVDLQEYGQRELLLDWMEATTDHVITLPCHDIVVTLKTVDGLTGGTIKSSLHDPGRDSDDAEFDAGVDAVESFILAAAIAGVDIESPAFLQAIDSTVEGLSNHLL